MLKSRKFKITLVTAVASLVLILVGAFLPAYKDLAEQVVKVIVPLALMLVGGIALEDAGAKAGGKNFGE